MKRNKSVLESMFQQGASAPQSPCESAAIARYEIPHSNCFWIISLLEAEFSARAFGLESRGFCTPSVGWFDVVIDELDITHIKGLRVKPDIFFRPVASIRRYAELESERYMLINRSA